MIRPLRIAPVLFGLLLCAGWAIAQGQDVRGSKDHPLLTRYPGSVITKYLTEEYDEFELPLGALGRNKLEKSRHLEGKITHIEYENPKGRSVLEIYRNFESALRTAGFEILFTCASVQQCGSAAYGFNFFPRQKEMWIDNGTARHPSAKLSRPQGDVYVSLAIQQHLVAPAATTLLDVIEMKPMEAGLVTVNAESLAGDINRAGHASVYGIYFDTGKADVKPESDAALAEIAKLLQQDPKLKLYVVGHTDNQGALDMNMDLSRRRADAVVKVLTTKYSVAPARLHALGDGPSAPVASNDTEEGRAKNRRVELVKQ